MAAVHVLVGHEQNLAITQKAMHVGESRVLFAEFQSQYFFNLGDLFVFRQAFRRFAAHVQDLAFHWIDAVDVPGLGTQTGNNSGFGRIALAQNQDTQLGLFRAREIRVGQFRNAVHVFRLAAVHFLGVADFAHFCNLARGFHDPQFRRHVFNKTLRNFAP